MTKVDQIVAEIEATSEVINDHLWYVNPRDIRQKLEGLIEKEIVICAAIRAPDGYIIRGHRHSDAIRTMSEIPRYKDMRPYSGDQGFVTSRNRFVGRVEACQIQKAAGIKSVLSHVDAYLHGELFSEDLY